MRILVAGITGQLGHGLVEAARERDIELVPVSRRIGRRDAATRLRRAFPREDIHERVVEGDVSVPFWGLDRFQIDELAGGIDAVLNLAGETNWAAPERRLAAVNVLGAVNGYALAVALERDRAPLYCYVSSIHAAGGVLGQVAETPFAAHPHRTPYEQAKWAAEERLLDPVRREGAGPPVAIARVGGLVGNSRTGATAKRNSLYMLADRLDLLPRGVLPFGARGRVDMLPRDVAADVLLRLVAELVERPRPEPTIVHVCAGESAPTTESLLAAARGLEDLHLPRTVRLPAGPLVWASQHLDRLTSFSAAQRNALMGLRYISLERWFERGRLAGLIGEPLPRPSAEELARLAFERPIQTPAAWTRDPVLARFEG